MPVVCDEMADIWLRLHPACLPPVQRHRRTLGSLERQERPLPQTLLVGVVIPQHGFALNHAPAPFLRRLHLKVVQGKGAFDHRSITPS